MKNISPILFVSLVICFFVKQTVLAQTPPLPTQLTPNLFLVTTDKTAYAKGEAVRISVTNHSGKSVRVDSYSNPPCPLEQFLNQQWTTVPSVSCSCDDDVQCNMSEAYIDPKKTYEFSWTQTTSWCVWHGEKSAPAKPGIYRVTCPLNDPLSRENRIDVVSQNFIIKE
ncbi:MAG: hypothetical protein ACD_62C00083G0017 [uncultured bacterium]|nr:MAG: hypothetical protein ACD_62C00083G0017 [uncultured bacterium]HLD45112.1 hypothetical protein [bacterium]